MSFTNAMNNRRLAAKLRFLGYTTPPDHMVILQAAREDGGDRLTSWVKAQEATDIDAFRNMLEFWMSYEKH